jgi:hypothetical protein
MTCKNCSFPLKVVLRFLQASMGAQRQCNFGYGSRFWYYYQLIYQMYKKESDPKFLFLGGAMYS